MGPRPLGRGRSAYPYPSDPRMPLQWGRDLSAAEGGLGGAASRSDGVLQWGRDLSAAEGFGGGGGATLPRGASMGPRPLGRGRLCLALALAAQVQASMGPRPLGRGRQAEHDPAHCRDQGFNGAATSRPRKAVGLGPRLRPAAVASMGPRPLGRGRLGSSPLLPTRMPLQWGRDLSAAEGSFESAACQARTRFNGAATSRPRKAGRGVEFVKGGLCASMGPRPLGRGRTYNPPVRRRPCRWLQWGRDLSAAEGTEPKRARLTKSPLQWGRDLSAAEGLWWPAVCQPHYRHSVHSFALSSARRAPAFGLRGPASGVIGWRRAPQARGPLAGPLARPRPPRRRPLARHTTNDGLRPPPCCSRAPIVSMRPSEPSAYEGPTSTNRILSSA